MCLLVFCIVQTKQSHTLHVFFVLVCNLKDVSIDGTIYSYIGKSLHAIHCYRAPVHCLRAALQCYRTSIVAMLDQNQVFTIIRSDYGSLITCVRCWHASIVFLS